MFPILQAGSAVVDWDLLLKLGGFAIGIAVGWGILKQQGAQNAKTLDQVVSGLATAIETGKAATSVAQEALRQATAGHGRIDRADAELRRLREQFISQTAKQEERSRLLMELKATGRLKAADTFTDGWTGEEE